MAQEWARIETEADVAEGFAHLCRIEPRFAVIAGPLPLRRRADGFAALLNAIVGQQVSTASAAAIWGRLQAAGLDEEAAVSGATEADLQACGLSRPKVRYAKALAAARIDYGALREAPVEEVLATLIAVPGIGRWTAEIYAKFALGHGDVFAAGDLALQEGAKLLFELSARPSEKEMRAMAEAWRPVRAIAARALWAYYREKTKREGAI
ncbi:DNA-3-methyladenine glycosylase family protein [Gymnodinialimonas ceratoperidinii]|uniref:DNA-3-methyladenine glycosylase II n=1 Tax=Gymnodinialimonas ceratoperidinii TaxID=2856823 RepID=A0A8F6TVU4_9RHOB|nr:DNA-3-methyladenine glycosylase 2 family protein [Gymnodinialimonas ceratoperidinii]QXT38626.1 DNA-3-methyladenine glycosylase 2 family protein [Gymnodinialimonas ceratoperidinii]